MKRSLLGAPPSGRATLGWLAWSAATSVLFSCLLVGCAGSLDPGVVGNDGTGGGGGGTPCQDTIFATKCVGCHATASQSASLDLQSANPGARLLNHMTGADGACPGLILLMPGSNPAAGVFIDKITMAQPTCGGSRMPIGDTLSATELTCLTTWATSVTTGSP